MSAACIGLWPAWGLAQSLPQGGSFAAGNGTISATPQQLQINQGSARAIINWNSFSIGAGNAVAINNGSGATLNRVPNGPASAILGNLSATGTVYLVNPAGVVVGPGGRVVTGGSFVASTRDIANSNFMASGAQSFQGSSEGAVDNQGQITSTAGNVYLIGRSVQNEGTINAPTGTAGLAGGQEVLISVDPGGSTPSVYIKAGPGYFQNSGTISAAQAELAAAGGNALALSGANSGVVRATGTVMRNGRLWLTAGTGDLSNTGTLAAQNADGSGGTVIVQTKQACTINFQGSIEANGTAPGTMGGTVELLGELVGVFDDGHIAADGPAGGGTVLVGGNYQGKGPQPNATATYLAPTASISADATVQGDGGRVIVWGTDSNRTYGVISARGGAAGGNGGLVEVSSLNGLSFDGSVDTTAPNGQTGTLLLDPQFLTVATAGGAAYNPGTNNLFANPLNPGTNTITPASINGQASNVTLQANTDVTIAAGVGNAIAMTAPGIGITIQAGRSVLINNSISTNNGAISITANDNTALSANRSAGVGNITMAAGTSLNSGTADINLSIGSSAVAPFAAGNMSLAALSANNANLTVPGASTITQSAALTVPGTLNLNGGSGAIALNNLNNNIDTLQGSPGTGLLSYREADAQSFAVGTLSAGGSVSLQVGTTGTITQSGPLTVPVTLTLTGGSGAINLGTDPGNNITTLAGSPGSGLLSYREADGQSFAVGTLTSGGDVSLQVGGIGAITQSGILTVPGSLTVTGGSGPINLATQNNNIGTLQGSPGSGLLSYREAAAQSFAVGVLASTGDVSLQVQTTGIITQTGALTVPGNLTVTGGSGTITLDNAGNNIGTLLGSSGTGLLTYREADAQSFAVGTLTSGGSVSLQVGTTGTITQSGVLTVPTALSVTGGSGDINLGTQNNNIGTLQGSPGSGLLSYREAAAQSFAVGTLSSTGTGDVSLQVQTTGTITQTGALTTRTLTLTGGSGAIALNNLNNNIDTLQGSPGTGLLSYREADAQSFAVGTLTSTGTGDISLRVGTTGSITLMGALSTRNLTLTGGNAGGSIAELAGASISTTGASSLAATGIINLPNAANAFTGAITIAGIAGVNPTNVTIDNGAAMTVNGFTATGAILLTTELGNLTKTGAIASTAASGGNITLAAAISQPRGTAGGGDVKSTAGALTPGAGAQALVYSGAVATTTLTGFAPASGSGNFRYDRQYLDAVGALGVGSGPIFILYREQPTVTITPDAATKVYGTADPTFTFSAVGLQNGDTAAQAGIDNTVITRQAGETVNGGTPYLFNTGITTSQLGYNLSVVNPSSVGLTITPATLTISGVIANDKVYDGGLVATLNTGSAALVGVLGLPADDVTLLTGGATGAFGDKNVNVGPPKKVTASGFAITGGDSGNYMLTQPTGLTANITPATLHVAASSNATKEFGTPDPIFGSPFYTVNPLELKGGDTASVVTGAMGRLAGESIQGSPYFFDQGSLATNTNYTLAFSNAGNFGLFIVVPADVHPVPVAPMDVSGLAGIQSYLTSCGLVAAAGDALDRSASSGGAECGRVGLFFKGDSGDQVTPPILQNTIANGSYFD